MPAQVRAGRAPQKTGRRQRGCQHPDDGRVPSHDSPQRRSGISLRADFAGNGGHRHDRPAGAKQACKRLNGCMILGECRNDSMQPFGDEQIWKAQHLLTPAAAGLGRSDRADSISISNGSASFETVDGKADLLQQDSAQPGLAVRAALRLLL